MITELEKHSKHNSKDKFIRIKDIDELSFSNASMLTNRYYYGHIDIPFIHEVYTLDDHSMHLFGNRNLFNVYETRDLWDITHITFSLEEIYKNKLLKDISILSLTTIPMMIEYGTKYRNHKITVGIIGYDTEME